VAAELVFEFDSKDLEVWRDARLERAVLRAVSMAGNDAIGALRVAASRGVREKKKMKLGKVNKALRVIMPRSRSSLLNLVWRLSISGSPVPVSDYPAREVAKGVSVEINVGSRKTIASAFIAVLKSGHRGVFKRVGDARLPIRLLYTTRVTDVFKGEALTPVVMAEADKKFASSFARLLPIQLGKLKQAAE
jgi:hypothetical protein